MKFLLYKSVSFLICSLFISLYCIIHIQNQAKQIEKLTQKNEELIESISKLNLDIAKYGEKINTINSTSLPVIQNTVENGHFLNKPVLFCCALVLY